VLALAPDGEPAVRCRYLRRNVLLHELSLTAEVTRLPAKRALHVRARNIDRLHLRLYKVAPTLLREHLITLRPLMEVVLQRDKPIASWSAELRDAQSHRTIERNLDVPVQENGSYLVVASDERSFRAKQSLLEGTMLNVTDLAVAHVDGRDAARL